MHRVFAVGLFVACGGTSTGRHAASSPPDRQLVPADVGLPDAPEPDPTVVASASPSTRPDASVLPPTRRDGFARYEECRQTDGCLIKQVTTDDGVETTYSCPLVSSASHLTYRVLRKLTFGSLQIDGRLERAEVRAVLLAFHDRFKRCLAATTASTRFDLRGTIVDGLGQNAGVTGVDPVSDLCLRETIAHARFPSAPAPTSFVLQLVYSVEDPTTQPHLDCPKRSP